MALLTVKSPGNYGKARKFLNSLASLRIPAILKKYGDEGVRSLRAATPVLSSTTANSWYYEIKSSKGEHEISFMNSNINKGVPIAIILQYGHGTRNGGYVQGRDYINPALAKVFDQIADEAWKEVSQA